MDKDNARNIEKVDLDFIKQERLKLGLSLKDMAEALGFKNASTYMKYEEGSYSFKAKHLPVLARRLECNIENFFTNNFAKTAKTENHISFLKGEVG